MLFLVCIKIYPQNQVILDCIMPSISLKHKCLSIILSMFLVNSSGLLKNFFFTFLIGKNRHGIGKKGGYFPLQWGRNSAPREGQKIPCFVKIKIVDVDIMIQSVPSPAWSLTTPLEKVGPPSW